MRDKSIPMTSAVGYLLCVNHLSALCPPMSTTLQPIMRNLLLTRPYRSPKFLSQFPNLKFVALHRSLVCKAPNVMLLVLQRRRICDRYPCDPFLSANFPSLARTPHLPDILWKPEKCGLILPRRMDTCIFLSETRGINDHFRCSFPAAEGETWEAGLGEVF
jgi:hypothetical protein